MRGATTDSVRFFLQYKISIHAPHARSDTTLLKTYSFKTWISIHAPHARSDHLTNGCCESLTAFQSTLLMRGATCIVNVPTRDMIISIHAPHARSDDPWIDALVSWTKISIHAPHARSDDILDTFGALEDTFQSTLLMRGATCRGGNDAGCEHDFNPRSSCEERRLSTRKRLQSSGISIHAPHARSD